MRYNVKPFFWLILFFSFTKISAQIRCRVEQYTTENGLSHERGTEIIKDSEGFIWAGSWDGINRFDGDNFISYKSFPGDWAGLKNDRIDQLEEDKEGNFWLKGVDEYYRFNKIDERFTPVSEIIKELSSESIKIRKAYSFAKGSIWFLTKNKGLFYVSDTKTSRYSWLRKERSSFGLPSDTVNFVHKDLQNSFWIATVKGLARFRVSKGKLEKYGDFRGLGKLNFRDCFEDDKNVYFSTKDGFIVLISKANGKINTVNVSRKGLNAIRGASKGGKIYCTTHSGELIVLDLKDYQISHFSLSPNIPLLSIYEDRTGNLWLEPESKGTIRFDTRLNTFKWFFPQNKVKPNKANYYKIFEDRAGRIWICMRDAGLGYYNPSNETVERMYQDGDRKLYRLPDILHGIYYDDNDLIWISTGQGIIKVILHGNEFDQRYFYAGQGDDEDDIRALYRDRRNRLWVGTINGGLQVLDAKGKPAIDFKGLSGAIYSITEDYKGRMWIGTKYNGLYLAEPLDQSNLKYRLSHYDTANSHLSNNNIFSIYEDNRRKIWIGTFGGGLNQAEFSSGKVIFRNMSPVFKCFRGNLAAKIRHINSDRQGNLWLATTDGLFVLKTSDRTGRNLEVKRYTKIAGNKSSLGDNDVQFVLKDRSGKMWLATSGSGICRVDSQGDSLSFKSYLKQDGLSNDYVVSIIQGGKGKLWLATQDGLSCFDPKNDKFYNYDHNEGLLKTSLNSGACESLADGSLAFGSKSGYVVFHPDRVRQFTNRSNIVFTHLQINNSNVAIGGPDSILQKNINYTRELNLNYDQNTIGIDFSNLDLRAGKKHPMFFRLKDVDKNWQSDHSRRRATYTNLSPGDYTFEVALSADAGDAEIKTLAISVRPPFWRSIWAYIFYGLLIALLVRLGIRISKTVLKLRQDVAVQKRMADLKVDFFTNVSHELRTPLTLILNPIEEIEKRENLSEKGTWYVQVVKRNVERMVRFMNQWLDLRRIQGGKYNLKVSRVELNALLKKSSAYFIEICQERNLKMAIISEQAEVFAWLDEEKLDIVIYNLLANAVKYTLPGNTIFLEAKALKDDWVIFSVADQGIGVPADKLDQIFELYYCDNLESKGTGIGLAFSRELIKLHEGEIYASNNQYGGLTISIELKAGKDHFDTATTDFDTSGESMESADPKPDMYDVEKGKAAEALGCKSRDELPVILLVEDNNDLREFLKQQLEYSFRIVEVANGREGLKKAKSISPDLILSDVMMPVMNGIDMLNALKNDSETSHIPIILLTAKSSVESQIEGLKYGADYYITKPFKTEFLFSAINNLITGRKKIFDSIINRNVKVDLSPSEVIITCRDEAFLKKVIEIVEEEMTSPLFNIDMIAEKVGMGRTAFYTKFKSLTNLAPIEFVRDMRLKRAKQLLDTGETNVSTVAYSVGFNNAKYFSTSFKEKFRLAPKEYVKNLAEA